MKNTFNCRLKVFYEKICSIRGLQSPLSVYEQYARAPEVTRKRLFLETMEAVLADSNKVIMENGEGGTGVVPYLPLPEIDKKSKGSN